MDNTTIEQKKAQMTKYAKWGIIGVFAAVLAPVAWLAVTGIAGIMVALGMVALGQAVAPVLALKLTNAKYRALDAEKVSHIEKVVEAASENPIETVQLQYDQKIANLNKFANGITEFRTEIKNYEGTVKEVIREYPEEAEAAEKQLNFMRAGLKSREEKYEAVKIELDKLAATIRKMQSMWKLAMATQRMNKLAGMNTGDEFARIKTEAAVDSVMSNVNKAFAEMETEVMVNKKTASPAITNNPQPTLQVVMSAETQTVKGN